MRYELDANGYVIAVFWGCHSGDCAEYTGTVPYGYTDLNDWSINALINAYYIENGNLVLDSDKLAELEAKIEQETIDNEPLYYKDLYGTNNVLNAQYQSATAKGKVLAIDNVKRINPKVKITDIKCYESSKVDIITQSKQMLKNDAKTETISGVNFYRNPDGSIRISGTSTEAIEYNLSGSENNFTSLFALKQNENYYLNIGGLECEMKFYDGTTSQVYTGASGLINLSENKEVTQVLIKIPANETLDTVIRPMLNYGDVPSEYESYKERRLTLDFSEYIEENPLYPSDDLFPSDDLYPRGTTIELYIEDGKVYVYVNGARKYLCKGNVNLYDGFNTIYTMQESTLNMSYSLDLLDVETLEFLQGKATTDKTFKILQDGGILINANINTVYNFTQENIDRAYDYIKGDGTLTTKELELYDVNGDGIISISDITAMAKMVNGVTPNVIKGHLEINTQKSQRTIILRDENGKIVTSIGLNGIETQDFYGKKINSTNIEVKNFGAASDDTNVTNIYPTGINTPSVTQTSLATSKKNFELLESGLDIINKTDIYKYNMKFQEDTDKKHIGFVIGDEFNYSEEITSEKNNGVDLYSMVSVCFRAIQEQQLQIEELKKEMEELKNGKN